MSINQATKKQVFRLFAAGASPEIAVEKFEKLRSPGRRALITQARAETLYEEYLTLPIGEKLRLTLMTENVSNRLHRLMDDIADLSLVDGLLTESDKKALALLLDIKRKIKERLRSSGMQHIESWVGEMAVNVQFRAHLRRADKNRPCHPAISEGGLHREKCLAHRGITYGMPCCYECYGVGPEFIFSRG